MKTEIELLATNPYLVVGIYVLAIVGFILAIIFYLKSKREKKPCYQVHHQKLVEGLHEAVKGLKVLFNDKPQERITVANVIFWNSGKETIRNNDLVEKDPVLISVSNDADVLDARIIRFSSEANQYVLLDLANHNEGSQSHRFKLSFDFMDNLDYVVIQIVHTGDKKTKVIVKGKIKGVKSIEKIKITQVINQDSWEFMLYKQLENPVVAYWSSLVLALCVGLFGVWNIYFSISVQWWHWFLVAFGLLGSLSIIHKLKTNTPVDIFKLLSSNRED